MGPEQLAKEKMSNHSVPTCGLLKYDYIDAMKNNRPGHGHVVFFYEFFQLCYNNIV